MCKKSYQRLDLEDRIAIEVGLRHAQSYSQIAPPLKVARDKRSIQREVPPWGRTRYRAIKAQDYYQISRWSKLVFIILHHGQDTGYNTD